MMIQKLVMETIGQIMGRQNVPQKQQKSSLDYSQKMMLIRKYGNREQFVAAFSGKQSKIVKSEEECYFGDYPTLSMMRTAYGENCPTGWLVPQLHNLSEYCGCKEKLVGAALEQCAMVIATNFFFLKVSELALFFHRFKAGRYGVFYGSVDPLKITSSLRKFVEERANAYEKRERENALRKIEEEKKDAITWEEYCKRHDIESRDNPLYFI